LLHKTELRELGNTLQQAKKVIYTAWSGSAIGL